MSFSGLIDDRVPYRVSAKSGKRTLTELLPMKVSVYDVDDIEGFVNDCILRSRLPISDQDERDDLVSEGIALLLHMARNYKPGIGCFSGYCISFLTKKIVSAWHKLHPEHLQITVKDAEGKKKRVYRYGDAPVSLTMQNSNNNQVEYERLRAVGDFVSSS